MAKKNLLFICGEIGENSSQGVRYRNLLPHLANHFSVTLLSSNKFFHSSEIENILLFPKSDSAGGFPVRKNESSVFIKMKGIYKMYVRPFIFPDKYKYNIPLYKKKIKEILNERVYNAVLVGMTPYSLYVLPKFIKEQNGLIKTIVDLSDPFLNNAGNHYAFIYSNNHIEKFERNNLKFVDTVVVLNPSIKKFYHEIYSNKSIEVIEQGLNEEIFTTLTNDNEKNKKPILVYGGGLYHKIREPFELYKAVDQLLNDVEFRVFGNINESLQPVGYSRTKYFGQVNQDKLAEEYYSADIIVFIDNKKGMQVPGKLLELLVLHKPILYIYSNPESPSNYYASESEWVVRVKNNKEEIIEGIDRILSSQFNSIPIPDLSKYYWENLSKKYTEIIND